MRQPNRNPQGRISSWKTWGCVILLIVFVGAIIWALAVTAKFATDKAQKGESSSLHDPPYTPQSIDREACNGRSGNPAQLRALPHAASA